MINYTDIIKPDTSIGIIDADLLDGGTRHPNLALMKISGYCKEHGCFVKLLTAYDEMIEYDIVFVSRVFTFTSVPENITELENVYCGGTGFYPDGGQDLPNAIEHHMPDYSLYEEFVKEKIAEGRNRSWFADYLDYSIGFTTRGCFRKCSFCVNKKYSRAFKHSPVNEFVDENRPYIYLWDDNFLAFPKWEEILEELQKTGKPFQFRQGLDIRLLNDRKAKKLAKAHYIGDFIFAFDHIEDRECIEKNLGIWRKYTDRGTRLYVLCAYDSQDEKDIETTFERISILMKYGCLPYIMRYEYYKNSKWRRLYVNIARWCNQPQFFKKMSFRQFCLANQKYHKNQETKCSALASMEEFEAEFPELATRYFDLRYEEQNMLMRYGRKFFVKPSEETSNKQSENWRKFASGKLSDQDAIKVYYDKDLDIVWAEQFSEKNYEQAAYQLFDAIMNKTINEIYECLLSSRYEEPITPENIPQYSSLIDVGRCAFLLKMLDGISPYNDLGVYLHPDKRKDEGAHKKYGENHGKTAALLDLGYVVKSAEIAGFRGTYFDKPFDALRSEKKKAMQAKLSLRIPIIRRMLVDADKGIVFMGDYMDSLSDSTKKRRKSNISKLLDAIADTAQQEDDRIVKAIDNIRREV